MAREGLTPTPSGDLDVFGKELPLSTAEKQILTGEQTIFLKKALSIEIVVKKGEATEPRVLVISSSKCFILSHRPTAKLETSFNFLKIQTVECTEKTLTFHLSREPRPLKFHLDRKDSVEILGLITAQLKNVFPVTSLEMLMQMVFTPVSLREDITRLRDSLLSAMERLDPTSLHGFITSYGFLCDFFGVPVNEGVTWYLRNVYLTHGFRDLKLHDFNHLAPKELRPIVSALRHSEFFEGIVEKDNKTDVDLLDEIGYVLNASRALKTLVLSNCSLKPDNVVRLSVALKNNPRTCLTTLDLSHNPLDDKAVESLGAALEQLTHGLQELRLANCKIAPRAATTLANCMVNNKLMKNSLVHLDLSANPLGPDPQGSLGFLKEPQTIATLNLSNCGLSFEFVTPVLMRGCNQHLRVLDLSTNSGRSKRGGVHGPKTASQLQKFFSSAISIATINFSGCKLTGEMAVGLLEGLCVNPNVQNIDLNLSGNDLGAGRDPSAVAKVIAKACCVKRLDVSESGIDSCVVAYVAAVRMNKGITHLSIGRNFNGKGNSRAAALNGISEFLTSDDCHLRSLCLADSHLRDGSAIVLEALAENRSLTTLNISGNGMGNHGARRLAKALLSNCSLREVIWDHNDTSLNGFRDITSSMEHNYTLRVMPVPLHDIGRAAAREPREVESEVQRMQVYLCRNHSDERLKIELAARHRQRLLTATQQSGVVSRELVQLEDLLKWSERGLTGTEENEGEELVAEATLIREEANKVVQLTDGLYAPHVEQEQLESVRTQVTELLGQLMENLHQQHVQDNSELMVSQSVKACPSLLTDKDRQRLSTLVITDMGSEFDVAKKTVVHKVVSEIINPISASNLDLAATISEYLVEKTLGKLEKINSKLIKLQKALQRKTSSGATPDQKVSRAFTFRVEGEESQPKVKRRRPVSTYSDSIDLPSGPLATEAPQLQHIAKSRPKPARLQKGGGANRRPHKPAHLAQAKDEVDVGDFVKAVKEAEQNSLRSISEEGRTESRGTVPKTPLPLPTGARHSEPLPLPTGAGLSETKTKVADGNTERETAAPKEPPPSVSITPPPPTSSEEKTEEGEEGEDEEEEGEVENEEEEEKEEEKEEVVEETEKETKIEEDGVGSEVKEEAEPAREDNDSEEEEEEEEEEVAEEKTSSLESASEKVTVKTAVRSPPLTPPPSPPHDALSPPLVATPGRKTDESTSTNDTGADESSSSLEIPPAPKKEPSPSPSEESTSKDRKKSRKESKKEEKERKEREKEEREREKKEREEKERLRKEKEKEDKEREKKEREEKERLRKEKEKEREKREREEKERQRKEKEKEKEKEREKREKEEKEKQKKTQKNKSTEDLLGVDGGRSPVESSPSRSIDKRKSKTVRDNRKKSGLSKLFSRPKAKEEGDEEDGHTNDEEATAEPHKSPRRQTTSPKGDKAEEREAEDRVSMTPEPLKKAPPPVRKKPVKSRSVDFGMEMGREEEGEEGGEGEKRRRPVGGVAAMPLPGLDPSKLTGVLKSRPSPQRRTKPSSSEESSPALPEKTVPDSAHTSSSLATYKTPPIAPRPRPKPKPRKSGVDIKEKEEAKEEEATPTATLDPTEGKGEKQEGGEEEEGEKKKAPLEDGLGSEEGVAETKSETLI